MRHIIYSSLVLLFFSSCAGSNENSENMTVSEDEIQKYDVNDLPDVSLLNLPNEAFVFDSIVEITATASINSTKYNIFSSKDPNEFKQMSEIMSTTIVGEPGCLYLGIISFEFADGSSEYVEFSCHNDCHFAAYITEDDVVIRELTQNGIEYLQSLLMKS